MRCRCGCGCTGTIAGESDYCRRCQHGDCPHPDELIPAQCPHCGSQSNLAVIEEFGWCLAGNCTHPRNDDRWKLALRRGY